MNNDIKEILDNIKKYQFQLLTSTGLGHEYFYCYGDDRFENWLKRKNIKYKIVKSDLLDYITKLQEENERLKEILHWKQIENNIFYKSRIDKAIEEKEIPEKLGYFDLTKDKNEKDENGDDLELHYTGVADTFDDVYEKINEIIDYLKRRKQ